MLLRFQEMPKIYPRALLMMGPANQAFSRFYSDDPVTSGRGRRGRPAARIGGAGARQNVILQYFTR